MSKSNIVNLSPGPAVIDESVKAEVEQLLKYGDCNHSIIETSHTTKWFQSLAKEVELLIRELLNVSEEYSVLLLSGGARLHSALLAMNYLQNKALYVHSGYWSGVAEKEASSFGIDEWSDNQYHY